jgi:hypothetical protein
MNRSFLDWEFQIKAITRKLNNFETLFWNTFQEYVHASTILYKILVNPVIKLGSESWSRGNKGKRSIKGQKWERSRLIAGCTPLYENIDNEWYYSVKVISIRSWDY